MNFCECGCIEEVKGRFVQGHNFRVQERNTPEVRAKISKALKGKPHSDEHNRKVGEANKVATKRYFESAENRASLSTKMKKVWEENPNMEWSRQNLLYYNNLRKWRLVASGHKGKKHSEEWKMEKSEKMKEMWTDKEYKAKKSTEMKELWKNKEYSRKVMARREKSTIETDLEQLLLAWELPYIFVGNGQYKIGSMNPDFVSTDGSKKVIEAMGEFFHPPEDEPTRIMKMRSYGFSCLVLWGSDIGGDKKTLLSRVKEFHYANI